MIKVKITRMSDGFCVFEGDDPMWAECVELSKDFVHTVTDEKVETSFKLETTRDTGEQRELLFRNTDLDERDLALLHTAVVSPGVLVVGVFLLLLKEHGIELKARNFKVKRLKWQVVSDREYSSTPIVINGTPIVYRVYQNCETRKWRCNLKTAKEYEMAADAIKAAETEYEADIQNLIESL